MSTAAQKTESGREAGGQKAAMRRNTASQKTESRREAAGQKTGSGRTARRSRGSGQRATWPSAPYLRSRVTTGDLMYVVVLALLPCAGVGLFHYGLHAAFLVGLSVLTAIVTEFLCDLSKRTTASVTDYSCVVTGLIGGLLLPPSAPLWTAAAEGVLSIAVFKHLSGGLGRNLFNPAMAARCVLTIAFRQVMLDFTTSAYTDVPPLTMLAEGETPRLLDMLTGNVPGSIGTSSAAAVLAAALILYLAGMIDLAIPLSAVVSFSVCYVLIGRYGLSPYTLGVQLCGGGFLFIVFIMAEDFTTSPVSRRARVTDGLILGVLIFIFRRIGFLEDGCIYSLLIVNALRPLLDRILPQAYFGAASAKWVIRQNRRNVPVRGARQRRDGRTNEELDAEFERFERQIERETRGLETARYTGDDTLLRQAFAETRRMEEGFHYEPIGRGQRQDHDRTRTEAGPRSGPGRGRIAAERPETAAGQVKRSKGFKEGDHSDEH